MLVLASASPRRRELLAQAGFSFQVHPAHIPEDPNPGEDPIAYVVRLAREKAQAVYHELALKKYGHSRTVIESTECQAWTSVGGSPESPETPGAPPLNSETLLSTTLDRPADTKFAVLGADTTVTLDNRILGKPESPVDAARMLHLLSGRTHRVVTGVALLTAIRTEIAAEVTAVQFLTLSDEEIDSYIATGEPLDKAGAYAIQGRAARWIPRIVGDYFNVVGLPIALVSTLLESLQPPVAAAAQLANSLTDEAPRTNPLG